MALGDIKREHVDQAIAEWHRLGADKFMSHFGVQRAKSFWLRTEGLEIDGKALLRVAHKFTSHGKVAISNEFNGGKQGVDKLKELGFTEFRYVPLKT